MPVGKEVLHQRRLLGEYRQEDLRRPGWFAATLFPIEQGAFGHPNALGELELGQPSFRAQRRDIHRWNFNARLSAGTFVRANITHGYLKPFDGVFSLCHRAG
jgi:hypothetical protein